MKQSPCLLQQSPYLLTYTVSFRFRFKAIFSFTTRF
nr:MAG TPA_asm: hypothetical protein [Caudoviricetes sp.]